MELLDSDNIFTDEELGSILANLDSDEGEDQVQEEENQEEEPVVENLDEGSESVGNDNEPPAQQQPGSPTPNLFNSIAAALREEGVFPDLDDETLSTVKDAGSFRSLIDKQIEAGLDERQRRINAALSNGVEPTEIQQYEGALAYLEQINDDMLTAKNAQGEDLRRRLIYQDLMNRGYSQEKALKEIKKSLDAGTDIDDARDAFEANKQFFTNRYKNILDSAKQQREQAKKAYDDRAKKFERSLLEDDKVFGSVDVDSTTRRRVLDALTKPTKRDENGNYYTELQWVQRSDPDQFSRNVGLLYVLTDGFKNINNLVKGEVNRRTNKGLADLERVINSTSRNPDGSLNLLTGVNTDQNSFIDDFELDV